MTQRLTKPSPGCKAALGMLALLLSATSHGDASGRSLRDCVTRAGGAAAVSICEQNHQAQLKRNLTRLTQAIASLLDNKQRLTLEKSTEAWSEFLRRERAMLALSLGMRKDGLGPKLEQGMITRLFEQREQQLREHLHNLSAAAAKLSTPGTE